MRKRTTLKRLSVFCFVNLLALAHGFGCGQHIANAGQGLQSAAMAQGDVKRAGPQLLKNAGESLVDIAEGWSQKNWEVVAYAAEDCSQCLHALSQIQSSSNLQRIYRTASGELHEVSLTTDGTGLSPNWERLAECLQEAAQVENEDPSWAMSLLSASKSIQQLVEESQ
uniref:Pectinesterase inhibitor domain-containing protein n=1 Tax=Amphora coffeiformis TaxID=265554 RepID=A0A7S3L5V2_9STRA|mmetsp:Transcript_387/g.719  ORF Transcript_387/g.719 Transcript_387/m.719 type:complete len:168 (-) Transcript_387:87-590(-)|eukprot:scaffold5383_cov222-Amphora_coffeaeformis.AAC.30